MQQPARRSSSNHSYLLTAVPTVLAVTRSTKPKDVQAAVQRFLGQKIGYQAAHKALLAIQNKDIEIEREQFRLLPAYFEVLRKKDPAGHFALTMTPEGRFFRLFLCPAVCQETFACSMKFVACDGTFTKSKFRQMLLLAVTVDGNDEVALLAWALVESENEDSWRFFFTELKR